MFWLLSLTAAAGALWAAWRRRDRRRLARIYAAAAVPLIVIALGTWPGWMVAEKMFTRLVLPCGMIWLALLVLAAAAWRAGRKGITIGLMGVWVLYTLLGNAWLASWLGYALEHEYTAIRPLDEGPFEVVFVLGGGTNTAPNGEPQLASAGDRVMLAARLYHAGRTPLVAATGERIAGLGGGAADPADEAARLLREIGLPEEAVIKLPGRNTREEMDAIAAIIERRGWRRVGLVTSAFHMRRALRLAEARGLALTPLPANFSGQETSWADFTLIPEASAYASNQRAAKELAAVLVNR